MIRRPPRSTLFPYTNALPISLHTQPSSPRNGFAVIARGAARLRGVSKDRPQAPPEAILRSEEHTSELQSLRHLVCRLLLEKKKTTFDAGEHTSRDTCEM